MLDTTFQALFLAGWTVGLALRVPYAARCWRNRIVDRRAAGLEWLLNILLFVGNVVLPLCYLFSPWLDRADWPLPAWAGWTGAAVQVAAIWLLWRSHADLGRNWSPTLEVREGHALVREGVYRYVRHPMYAAQWLWAGAQALLLQNWVAGLSSLAAFLPMYLLRVCREERMMLEHFDGYRSYMERTGRIVPHLCRRRPPASGL